MTTCNAVLNLFPPVNPYPIGISLPRPLHTRAGTIHQCATMKKYKSSKLACRICDRCGAPYVLEEYRLPRSKYCSFNCKQIQAGLAAGEINKLKRGTGTRGYVKENGRHQHRVVAEKFLGRSLLPGEIVHHKDENKHNNSPDNLEVITQSDHMRIHHSKMIAMRKIKAGY